MKAEHISMKVCCDLDYDIFLVSHFLTSHHSLHYFQFSKKKQDVLKCIISKLVVKCSFALTFCQFD